MEQDPGHRLGSIAVRGRKLRQRKRNDDVKRSITNEASTRGSPKIFFGGEAHGEMGGGRV